MSGRTAGGPKGGQSGGRARVALAVLALMVLSWWAGAAAASHRPASTTEMRSSQDSLEVGNGTTATGELDLVYEYSSFVVTVRSTETHLEVASPNGTEADLTPSRVEHPTTSHPHQRDPNGTTYSEEATVHLQVTVREPVGNEARLVVRANTTGAPTLQGSEDVVELGLDPAQPAGEANVSANGTAGDLEASGAAGDGTGEAADDERSTPAPTGLLVAAIGAAARRRSRL